MASNTKLGLALILLILTAFGFVVYKKAEHLKHEMAINGQNPNESPGDGKTFGSDQTPFESDADPGRATNRHASSEHDPFPNDHLNDVPRPRGDAPHELRRESQLAQADPGKPNLLEPKDELLLAEKKPQRLSPTDLRRPNKEEPAFGAELDDRNEPAPFEKDKNDDAEKNEERHPVGMHGQFEQDHREPMPGDPAHQAVTTKPVLTNIEVRKQPKSTAQNKEPEPFEADAVSKKNTPSKKASNDEFGEPFGGKDDNSPEVEPFTADNDADAAHGQAARKQIERSHPPRQKPVEEDAFEKTGEKFTEEVPPANDRTAKLPERKRDEWSNGEEMFGSREKAHVENRPDREPRKIADRHGQGNFIEGEGSTWGAGDSPHVRKPSVHNDLVEHPETGGHHGLSGGETYVVQPKDNFWSISRKKYGTARYFRLLAHLNQDEVPDPKELRPGMTIVTPPTEFLESHYAEILAGGVEAQLVSAEKTTQVTEGCREGKFYVDADCVPMYRVGSRDSLDQIAQRHLGRVTRWIQIFELNRDRLSSPNDLHAGTELVLPADARPDELAQSEREFR